MRMLFDNRSDHKPLVSIILLDWSCRESFHFLHYINNQIAARDQYEVIWIEYYDKQSPEIEAWLKAHEKLNKPPVIDRWIVMDMPKECYYHKHLMYNTGILLSSGDIVVICDSDGIVKPTFIQSIVEEFSKESGIFLHLDQLRVYDRKYYPFTYPSIGEIEKDAVNFSDGKPFGLVDTTDVLHNRNYGACFCAKRADIISIGGADEHIDYLGAICGPYELSFRLINAGKKEKWHQTEWTYHVWHPGQAGDTNFAGPHDGKMMSTTALDIIKTKRIGPLVENALIKKLRQSGQNDCHVPFSEITKTILQDGRIKQWAINFGETSPNVFQCYEHQITIYSLATPEDTVGPEISLLLATLRPDKARKCIQSIVETSAGVNYEVVVASPFDMCNLLAGCKGYHKLKFVKEEKKDGCIKAFTTAYENAAGKYVFAIADDHRLGKDCLKNLIEFMRQHDHEIFLAGTRCYGVYGAGPEWKAYGFHYAFNPCIRRDLVQQVGGFYDPYYKSYYGDPDLSMRVWHYGGKVELCPDAWVEYHNELDYIDLETHVNNAERDFKAFFKRWHPVYGHLAKSSNERDINVCNNSVLPGIPPEKCTRLVVFLRQNDWSSLNNELANDNNGPLNKDYLCPVFREMMSIIPWAPVDIIQNLLKWLMKQLFTLASFTENDITEILGSKKYFKIRNNPEPADFFLAIIAMFYLSGGLKRQLELVVENYKGINILYGLRKFYAWPCSSGGFSFDAFEESCDKFTFSEPVIWQAIKKIDELRGDPPLVDWQKVRVIEDYFSSCNFELFQNENFRAPNLEIMPGEICIGLVLCMQLGKWVEIEQLLDEIKENTFIIGNHISFVYGELLKYINMMPTSTVRKLSEWLLAQFKVYIS